MPGCFRVGWRHGLLDEVRKARDVGVNQVVLFPVVPNALKVRLQKNRDIIPSF
jgi:porphobilinogen synthase